MKCHGSPWRRATSRIDMAPAFRTSWRASRRVTWVRRPTRISEWSSQDRSEHSPQEKRRRIHTNVLGRPWAGRSRIRRGELSPSRGDIPYRATGEVVD